MHIASPALAVRLSLALSPSLVLPLAGKTEQEKERKVAERSAHAEARRNRSATPSHSAPAGGASTTIKSAPASSQRCSSA